MNDRLRVLFVPHAYAPVRGGTELLCQRLAETLAADGHDVRVLTTDAGSVDSYYEFGIPPVRGAASLTNGVEIDRVRLGGWMYTGLGPIISAFPAGRLRARLHSRSMQAIRWQLVRRLRPRLEAFRPDVVVTLPHLVVNVQAVLTIHRSRAFPLVMLPLLHEDDPHWNVAEVREALARADAVVAITRTERDRLIAAYGVKPEALFLGGMGVDVPEQRTESRARDQSIVFLGRKNARKGVPLLIEAMQRVWQVKPGVRLVLAGARGGGSDEIDALIRSLPPETRGNVASEDDVSESRKSEILESAACLVLPSRIESFGGVILEAWAHAVPAIALDLPVFREVIDRRIDGLLVPPGDAAALAEAILWILDNPAAAEAMGRAGLDRARSNFNWPTVSARTLEALRYATRSFPSRH